MVLATRENAQFLSDAVQGDGDPLSVLQEFERSPRPTLEELKPFEYEILSDLTTSMIYIVGDKVLLKLEEKMNSDECCTSLRSVCISARNAETQPCSVRLARTEFAKWN